jgi:NAD(P)-dependent dehydrogenase (short-subunit alcohol dehydrogenase family)
MVATNFVGAFHCLYYARRHLIESAGTAVLVITRAARDTYVDALGYGASKAGLVYLTRAAARDLGRDGVRVFAVSPGAVATKLRSDLFPSEDPSNLIQPNQVADAILAMLNPGFVGASGSILDLPW